ncbi:DUF899 family protein [Actinomycetospora termitidis]|uniref:DUF899 family protein n=1 Tax=Actinomycetospora termitidis TaxID=3053470 RepID=A0ABT7MC38_9PSEU|nr:DUF899 family protein [Actinomycetospora sp. Odt1-22]MDL5158208.1 DUF899 family protein [Actinomycetospora sp. Odt1-22]
MDTVTAEEFDAAVAAFREREKAEMRARDALAAARRRLPAVEVDPALEFTAIGGARRTLTDLFEGRPQLIVYQHMLGPGDDDPCAGCCMVADHVAHLDHLNARGVTFALTSRAPIDEIEAFRARMGWRHIPWYADRDAGLARATGLGSFQLDVFLREGDRVLRTYSTTGRGVEALGSTWSFLDLVPYGRQETWEDTPAGRPQSEPYVWWRRHGEYAEV